MATSEIELGVPLRHSRRPCARIAALTRYAPRPPLRSMTPTSLSVVSVIQGGGRSPAARSAVVASAIWWLALRMPLFPSGVRH